MIHLTPTPAQAERAARDRKISAEFCALRKDYPAASVRQILRTLASTGKYGLKPEGLKRVLLSTGDIKPVKRS